MFRISVRFTLIVTLAVFAVATRPVLTAASNARIIRLSLVQGDVRVLHDSKGDPLASDKATWSRADLNLPIRQHDVLATDNGRAEVEFENGAMAFLNANTVLEFFDLSLEDGSLTTRLILRQGTASFYSNPARGDYFSVTGGDFTAEAVSRSGFRMDNFDDGSTVVVDKGRISVLYKNDSQPLSKGQSLTAGAGEEASAVVGRAPDDDEFDRWVSGRVDSVSTATNAALKYSNTSSYVSGFGDLYTYGNFYPIAGYGYGWQPYGAGFGWSPFDYGNWYFAPGFGFTFIGVQPWGWLPYHYGGWIFDPGFGWLWVPTGFGRGFGPVRFRPVTATFVRSGSNVGLVPVHPLDQGKSTLNIARGVMPLTGRAGASTPAVDSAAKWKVVKEVPNAASLAKTTPASAPTRVTRSVASSPAVAAAPAAGSSTIVYDAREKRFVNSNVSRQVQSGASTESTRSSATAASSAAGSRTATAPAKPRSVVAPRSASARVAPPPAPRATTGGGRSESRGAAATHGTMTIGGAPRPSSSSSTPRATSSGRPH
jgi:hypothetical protein